MLLTNSYACMKFMTQGSSGTAMQHRSTFQNTVEPMTSKKCLDYQGVLIFPAVIYEKVPFWTSTKCLDYAGFHILKCPH